MNSCVPGKHRYNSMYTNVYRHTEIKAGGECPSNLSIAPNLSVLGDTTSHGA